MDNFIGQLLQDTNGMNPSFMRPSSPTTTATQAAPQRKRASVIDILGGLADAVATVGGSEPMYQPTLDAATERQRQTEADQMARQKFDLGKQQAGLEIQDQRNKLLVPAVAGLEAAYRRSGVEGLKKALPIAAQMFGVSPEQMQMLSASFDQDPEGTFTALHGLAGQAAEMKFIEGPDGTYAVDPRNPTMAPVRILGAKPTERKQSDDIAEYEYAFQNVPPEQRPAFTDWMRQNKRSGASNTSITNMMPGPKKADEAFAGGPYMDWLSGGYAATQKNIQSLDEAIGELSASKPGDLVGSVVGNLPEGLRSVVAPESLGLQQRIGQVVQAGMRDVLGAQFTRAESDQYISRAFDPRLGATENVRRLSAFRKALLRAAQAKQAASMYFQKNNTLEGFQGDMPTWNDFYAAIGEKRTEAPANGGWKYLGTE